MNAWKPAMDRRLIRHIHAGRSYAFAAAAIGVTRNAGLARLRRLKERFAELLCGGEDAQAALGPEAAAVELGLEVREGQRLLDLLERDLGIGPGSQ